MPTISVRHLTKQFGAVRAVDDLTIDIPPGRVTGFLGPNGAGKTTTLRSILGLVKPTSGTALVDGRPYAALANPRRTVGAVLESTGAHPGRTARAHLEILAGASRIERGRVSEVLETVGLADSADRRVGTFSMGMRQRLGLAGAMLGDPAVLLLDEPANGLDPEGIAWLRTLLRGLAAEGRTVLISSHLLSEVARTVDDVVIISTGRLRFAGPLGELGESGVSVRSTHDDRLLTALVGRGFDAAADGESGLQVRGASPEDIGRVAAVEGIALTALSDARPSLEAAFLLLTRPAGDAEPASATN
jgi:ABC-2 type transport system ATP-binding protein